MHTFKIGDPVCVPLKPHVRLCVAAVHGDYLWLLSSSDQPTTYFAGQCQYAKPADSDPLTQAWLDRVGLADGIYTVRGPKLRITLKGEWCLSDKTGWDSGVKNIGDARTLVRLLGCKLNEDE